MEQQHINQWRSTTKLLIITTITLQFRICKGLIQDKQQMTIFTEIGVTTSIPCTMTPEQNSWSGIGCPRMELRRVLWSKGDDTELLYAYWFVKQKGKKTPKH